MSTPIVIRECTPEDVAAILDLQREWAREGITHGFVPSSEEAIRDGLGPYCLVAETDHRIVGFVQGHEQIEEGSAVIDEGERCLHVDDLYVVPGLRDQGVGSGLLAQVMEAARLRGLRHVLVYSATKDLDSVLRFYRRHGFRTWFVQLWRDL